MIKAIFHFDFLEYSHTSGSVTARHLICPDKNKRKASRFWLLSLATAPEYFSEN